MALKRKPPTGNIRRIAPIGNNLRYTITSKADETVQCESFQERKLTLLFERDESILEYRSQPERFAFTDSGGDSHTYVPDFMVWRTTGEIEIHEVTLTERQNRFSIQEREKAARSICQQRGWRYIVHTEATLPLATEEANLLALYRYRPSIYANAAVTAALSRRLKGNERQAARILIPEMSRMLSLPEPTVISALCHLLWHRVIETDLTSCLLFVNAALTPAVQVWLNEKRRLA
ncbi:MAG TPA: TnsA endonuclease N-terminal domain-containing protein [Ktedonobacteraceae bacterium]